MYSEPNEISKMELFCENIQRLSAGNYFRRKLYSRYFTLFWLDSRKDGERERKRERENKELKKMLLIWKNETYGQLTKRCFCFPLKLIS